MSIFNGSNPLLATITAAGGAGYEIERSVRFNSADSAYLSRTPASAGNRKTWTWAGWVKRSAPGTINTLFAAGSGIWTGGTQTVLGIYSDDAIWFSDYNGSTYTYRKISTAVYRDASAWYHVVAVMDTTNATATDRVRLYVNGERVTSFGTSADPSLDYTTYANNNAAHYISLNTSDGLDGYLADVHFIDGQALDPTSFGFFDDNGIWQPKAYTGSYGTNGFHLDFSDNSTAAALGTDTSGNGNDWTVNNISVGGTGFYVEDVTGTPFYPNLGPRNAFDGNLTTESLAATSSSMTWTPSPSISASTQIRLYLYRRGAGDVLTLNGSSIASAAAAVIGVDSNGWYTIPGTSITSLVWGRASGPNDWRLNAVEVDGVILTDKTVLAPNNDSLVDVPTNGTETDTGIGGQVRGNYCTLNPLDNGGQTLSNGNLDVTGISSNWRSTRGSIGISSGKFYWEITIGFTNSGSNQSLLGIATGDATLSNNYASAGDGWEYYSLDGAKFHQGSNLSYGAAYTNGDVIGVAFDADNGTLTFYKNGSSQGTAYTGLTSGPYFPSFSLYGTSLVSFNAGQRPFAYTAPSGFKALCTTNLDAPTIEDPSTVMDVVTYTGSASGGTFSIPNFSPSFLWNKNRANGTTNHILQDAVRGFGDYKSLYSNLANDESGAQNILSVSGSTVTYGTNNNFTGATVTWAWDAGDSTVTNTDGSITSSVRANTSAGFSIVTWTAASNTPNRIGHGLGAAPHLIIVKSRTNAANWRVYTTTTGINAYMGLDETRASTTYSGYWGSTNPNSTTFGIWPSAGSANNYGDMVAYCFAPVDGYNSISSYIGNGSSDGPFVYTGHRVRWLMIKRTDSTSSWQIMDAARSDYNVADAQLYADLVNSEGLNSLRGIDFLSNGFKVRGTNSGINASNGTYVYVSFAENPFQYARAR